MKSFKKVYLAHFASVLAISAICFSSCNATDDGIAEQKDDLVEFKKDLVEFSNTQGTLMTTMLSQNTAEDKNAMNDIKKNLDILSSKYRNILNQSTRAASLTEDEIEILKMDSDKLLVYLQDNVSSHMYQICVKIFEEDVHNLDLNDIFNKNDLTPDEMFALANMAIYINNSDMETTRSTEDKCSDQYSKDRTICGVEYLASCALSCTGGPLLATAGVGLATYELDQCLGAAHDRLVCCRHHH